MNLTDREQQILDLQAQGKTGKDTATILGISEQTVKNHRVSIYKKVGARNSAEAVMKVYVKGGL